MTDEADGSVNGRDDIIVGVGADGSSVIFQVTGKEFIQGRVGVDGEFGFRLIEAHEGGESAIN